LACTWIEEGFFAALRMTTSDFFRDLLTPPKTKNPAVIPPGFFRNRETIEPKF
jgi:hypothetical protein